MKTHLIILMLFVAVAAHAQDPMAKWKPKVGDSFVYSEVFFDSKNGGSSDTVTETIVSIDDSLNDDNKHVVRAVNERGDTVRFLKIVAIDTSNSPYPIKVLTNVITNAWCLEDLSTIAPTGAQVTGRQLVVLDPDPYGFEDFAYSPTVCWIYRMNWNIVRQGGQSQQGTSVLISSSQLRSNVNRAIGGFDSIVSSGGFILISRSSEFTITCHVALLDALGRPVRSWQLAATDGPREITLNVSDAPSGVYFLRLQGDGVDEVKRVAIIH
jgi:hypothetical protein